MAVTVKLFRRSKKGSLFNYARTVFVVEDFGPVESHPISGFNLIKHESHSQLFLVIGFLSVQSNLAIKIDLSIPEETENECVLANFSMQGLFGFLILRELTVLSLSMFART